jgi:predicted ABC-type ATPase
MTEDERIEQDSIEFARAHKREIARELTDTRKFPPDSVPVSVFMAGSPGAGKTESSLRLIERLSGDGHSVLRIDSDDLRTRFPSYTGRNSSLFQSATSIIADKMQDLAIEQHQNYVFDGTLSNLGRARGNIKRGLDHGRIVQILYVYQDPLQAWKFVQAREQRDGRTIPKESFIDQYFLARENVSTLKNEFGNNIRVDLIVKNIDGTDFKYKDNIDVIDSYIPERYTKNTLSQLLSETL